MKCTKAGKIILKFCESKPAKGEERVLFAHLDRCEKCKTLVEDVADHLRDSDFLASRERVYKRSSRIARHVARDFYV